MTKLFSKIMTIYYHKKSSVIDFSKGPKHMFDVGRSEKLSSVFVGGIPKTKFER